MAALAATGCIRMIPEAGPSLAPLQLRVGSQGDADSIGHTNNAALGPGVANTMVFTHDWANTFNAISRADLFAVVASGNPSFRPFVNLMYVSRCS
jgi:hypothetical protein